MKQLAERRTDIFGVGDEETVIGKKLGEEETRKDERVTWDGHTSSVEAATRGAFLFYLKSFSTYLYQEYLDKLNKFHEKIFIVPVS